MIRRRFIEWCAGVLWAALGLALLVPGAAFLLSPLRGRRRASSDFLRLAALESLPSGRPVRLPVHDERSDAFTRYPRSRVGEVWLMRETEPGAQAAQSTATPRVTAFQVICPHLGCGIEFSAARGEFSCPCHTSAFALSGQRLAGPSPRDMDRLDTRVIRDDAGREWVEVRYQTFRTGTAGRQPLT